MGVFEAGFKKDMEVRGPVPVPFPCHVLELPFFMCSRLTLSPLRLCQLEEAKTLVHDAICAGIFNDLVRCQRGGLSGPLEGTEAQQPYLTRALLPRPPL